MRSRTPRSAEGGSAIATELELLQAHAPVLLADDHDRYLGREVDIYASHNGRWLQYWLAYAGDPDHGGVDWELVMVHVIDDQPVGVVAAQHRWAESRIWNDVEQVDGHPVIYVGRDKHASYFSGRWHRHGLHLERTNARWPLTTVLLPGVPLQLRKRMAVRKPDVWVAQALRKGRWWRR